MSKYKKLLAVTSIFVMSAPVFAADEGAGALASITGALTEAKPYGYAVISVLAGLMVFKFIKKVM